MGNKDGSFGEGHGGRKGWESANSEAQSIYPFSERDFSSSHALSHAEHKSEADSIIDGANSGRGKYDSGALGHFDEPTAHHESAHSYISSPSPPSRTSAFKSLGKISAFDIFGNNPAPSSHGTPSYYGGHASIGSMDNRASNILGLGSVHAAPPPSNSFGLPSPAPPADAGGGHDGDLSAIFG